MDNQELHILIEKLQKEIQSARIINENDKKQLLQIEAELQEIISRSEGRKDQIAPATKVNLEAGINQFEARHPNLTRLISQLLDDLSSAGI
jgi:hypothetical protein